jgi:hypothetical protein
MTDLNVDKLTPPQELVQQWCYQDGDAIRTSPRWYQILCAKAARWGADQELDACCRWADATGWVGAGSALRRFRRPKPKPPSRKEQALEAISRLCASVIHDDLKDDAAIVRRALEALPND